MTKIRQRIKSGEITDQKCWSFIRELNSFSEERLDSVAVRDGYRTYTYRQMFRYWEKYAEAFSGVHLTGRNHSRVGLIGVQQTETIFAFYALNMTGASVSLIYHLDLYDDKRIRTMIEREKITDLVISEVYAFPKVMKGLLRDRELLGLRNIIVLESPMGGEYALPPLEMVRKLNTSMFRELEGGLVMEDLMKEYEAAPIAYGNEKSSEGSIILHTTGTVSGIHKPVPMSDKALNSFVIAALEAKNTYEDFKHVPDHLVSFLALPLSWVYAMVDMLHTAFGLGMEVVCLPFGATNPRYADAIENYGISILFTSMSILDTWNKMMPDIDMSKVKVVFMGGAYVSPEFKKSFNDYLRSHGSAARIINGYGMSELGGACIIAPSDRDDDAIGFTDTHGRHLFDQTEAVIEFQCFSSPFETSLCCRHVRTAARFLRTAVSSRARYSIAHGIMLSTISRKDAGEELLHLGGKPDEHRRDVFFIDPAVVVVADPQRREAVRRVEFERLRILRILPIALCKKR